MTRVILAAWSVLIAVGQFSFGALCILRAIADAGAGNSYPVFAAAIGVLCIATAATLVLGVRVAFDDWRTWA